MQCVKASFKSLSLQRVKLVLHELNVASGDNSAEVGEIEFQSQPERHGGN